MNYFHDYGIWFSGLYFCFLISMSGWAWYRGRLYLHRYVYVLAAGLMFAGIVFTLLLPTPTNPHPLMRAFWPFFIPSILVIVVYVIAFSFGWVGLLLRRQTDTAGAGVK